MFDRTREYFKDVRAEFDKVSWPTWPELKSHTNVVLIVSAVVAAFIFVVDQVLNQLVMLILR
jgi:preprotein translocase subunit SecE